MTPIHTWLPQTLLVLLTVVGILRVRHDRKALASGIIGSVVILGLCWWGGFFG